MLNRIAAFLLCLSAPMVAAQTGTIITYQGELEQNGQPATGLYDFEFTLYDSALGSAPIGMSAASGDLIVDGGLFSADLDFGANIFGTTDLWLARILGSHV